MIIPVRCMTCNMVIGSKYEEYLRKLEEHNVKPTDSDEIIQLQEDDSINSKTAVQTIFEELKLTRYCCRRHLLAHVDLIDDI